MPSNRPRALFLSPEPPYPLAGGGALRTASLLNWLARTYDIDLLLFREPGAPDPAAALPPGLVRSVHVVPLRPHARHTPARAWRNFGRFLRAAPPLNDRFSGYESALAPALAPGRPYALALVEHFWCAPYAPLLRPHCARLVLDLHNIESVLHARIAAAAPAPEKLLMRRFAHALLGLERLWLPAYDSLLVASHPDRRRIEETFPATPVVVYPNAIPYVPPPHLPPAHEIVFSGNLQYHPNRAAVRFFHRRIWPLLAVRWPHLRWNLVGKNPAAVRALLAHDPRISLTGEVADAISAIAPARAAVVPLLSGSGTRVKILEAWAAAVPVVSTPLGAEGLDARDGEDILLADTPAAFAAHIDRILSSPPLHDTLAAAGRRHYERSFTWEAAWKNLDAASLKDA